MAIEFRPYPTSWPLTAEEVRARSESCTRSQLHQLTSSPEFQSWQNTLATRTREQALRRSLCLRCSSGVAALAFILYSVLTMLIVQDGFQVRQCTSMHLPCISFRVSSLSIECVSAV